ncbi:MAG: DedA family protein [Alicyclobacillaceae bacterium]|nr:DedA family protein [Alicyclobacillaceae bacterium]
MTLESACIPLPSEVIMPFGGYLVGRGMLDFTIVVAAGTAGNVAGSLLAYYAGQKGGRTLLHRYGRYIRISEHHLQKADEWFSRRGEITVLVGRLLPGIRTFISLPAGIASMPVGKFVLYTAVGSLPWVWVLAFVGLKLGQNWKTVEHYTHVLALIVAVLLVVGIVAVALKVRRGK